MDLALPYDVPCQTIANAVAQIMGLPVSDSDQQQYTFIAGRGKRKKTLSPSETLGEAQVSYGDYLELVSRMQTPLPQEATAFEAALQLVNGQVISIVGNSVLIGRKTPVSNVDVDLTDLDYARVVSKKHATLTVNNNQYYLRDEGSTNGTCINGRKLPPGTPQKLENQDIIELGGPKGVQITFVVQS